MVFAKMINSVDRRFGVENRVAVTLNALIDLASAVGGLTLHRSTRRASTGGGYVSNFKGRGMEFDETRLYQAGDDVRSIDWKVTARTGKAHTKIFREERERPVFISVDYRRPMHFATRGVFKSVMAARLAALLAWTSEHHGDRIGGQIFTDNTCVELKPKSGKPGVLRLLNALVSGNEDRIQRHFSLNRVLSRLTQHARPGSLVYIISDFRGMNDDAETHLSRLSQHCDVTLIFVYDNLERSLPQKGRYRVTDNVLDVVVDAGDGDRWSEYRQRFERRLLGLQQISRRMKLNLILCCTTDDPIQRLRFSGFNGSLSTGSPSA